MFIRPGLSAFSFSSNQALYTPYIIIASMGLPSIGLFAILIWILYHILMAKGQVGVIQSSGNSVHSETSTLPGGIADAIELEDVEKVEEKLVEPEESPTQEHDSPDRLKAKLQGGVKTISTVNTVLGAFAEAGGKKKCGRYEREQGLKPKLQIDNSPAAVPFTELILSDKPASTFDLARCGTIRDVAYSDDGKWLAITCAKENAIQSWTIVFDAETLTTVLDAWHEGRVISEYLKWSPSGKKLIVKFEHRFDVFDLDAKTLHIIERHHTVQDVVWFSEDAFLVAEHNTVFKMNLTKLMAVYRFECSRTRSIGFDRRRNYLVLITHTLGPPDQSEPACGRSEKRIVIYDMDKEEEIYQVPVLEDISRIYPIPDELDILITHKDQKAFQLWSLDAGIRGAKVTARLKKRAITPHLDPGDYIGPTCIGGNYNQFVLKVTTSGDIDIWRRESGMPYLRFQSSILRHEGVHCFSWRRSGDGTATFATVGINSHTLLVWRGEEWLLPEAPASLEPLSRPIP